MSIRRNVSFTKEVMDMWKTRKEENKGLNAITKDNAQKLHDLAVQKVTDQKRQAMEDTFAALNNTLKDIRMAKEEDDAASPELKKLMTLNKNGLNKKQLRLLETLDGAINAISIITSDFLNKASSVDNAHIKLTEAASLIKKLFTNVMKSDFRGFKKTLQIIYQNKLEINVKQYLEDAPKSFVKPKKSLSAIQLQKQFAGKFIEFTSYNPPRVKKAHKLFVNQIKKHASLLNNVIDYNANYWKKNDSFINFLYLITQDNLAKYLKNKIENGRESKQVPASDVLKTIMTVNGLKVQTETKDVVRLAKTLFEGEKGKVIKASLRNLVGEFTIYNGLIDMLSKHTPAEREKAFLKLINNIGENKWDGIWEAFFIKRPNLNLGPKVKGRIGPVDHAMLWDLRNELAQESHPIFASLNDKVNALYVSPEQSSLIQESLKPSTLSAPSSTRATPENSRIGSVSRFAGSMFGSVKNYAPANHNLSPDLDADYSEENSHICYI